MDMHKDIKAALALPATWGDLAVAAVLPSAACPQAAGPQAGEPPAGEPQADRPTRRPARPSPHSSVLAVLFVL